MKRTNLKIGTQLKIAFGIIVFLIVVLGTISWQQANELAQQTNDLYEHPHKVRRALGELKADILSIHRSMKDLGLIESSDEITPIIQDIEKYQADGYKQFEILYNSYLGPRTDIDLAYDDFTKWKPIREESILLVRQGNSGKALARTKPGEAGGQQVNTLLEHIQVIDNFARNKANQFLADSIELKKTLIRQLIFLVTFILGLTILITFFLNRSIRNPIQELAEVTRLFREGKMDARSSYFSANEFGQLSASFNELADTIETEMNLNIQSSKLAGIMLSEDDARLFCHALLRSLLEHTGAQMGAVYFLNDEKTEFFNFECMGIAEEGCRPFSALHFEGEFSAALSTQKLQHITSISENSRFTFHTVAGAFKPQEIITIPIISGNETVAVISLANIKSFSPNSIRLLNTILSTLSARMVGILTYRKMIDFSKQLEERNKELELQRQELKKVSSYNRSLIEASIDPLVTIGPDGRIMDVNNATEEVTGFSRNELVGTDFSDYFTEPDKAKAGYLQVFQEGSVHDYELAIRNTAGDSIPVLYNASVYRDDTGKVIGVFAAARIITERKKAEQKMLELNKELNLRSDNLLSANAELEAQRRELSVLANELSEQNIELEMQKKQLDESNRLKTSFLSNMSHELRTPLNSVIALSGVLNRRLSGKIGDEEYSYLNVIERNGKQLLLLINDILDLSRIEAGHENVEINRFNVRELIDEVVELIESQATQKNIHLHYLKGNDLTPIQSDYIKCRHILQNLVSNAVKFTEKGGVEIRVEEIDECIRISVSDSGIGIDQHQIPHIFDEFRQADGSNSRKYGGTGLGLAIAKKYAEMLGGKIEVESIRGKGSKFTLNLPIQYRSVLENIENYVDQLKAVRSGIIQEMNAIGKTILVVEDTEAIIIQMKDILAQQGYKILVARNGSEALELIEHQIPDAMILDLMMPEVDGFEVLKRIRNLEKTEKLPVIILTAKFVTKDELAFLKHNGILQMIRKGDINKEDLLAIVARTIFPETVKVEATERKTMRKQVTGTPVVLVVEDNPDNMITLKALLDGKCQIIEAEDGITGVALAKMHQPQLILMDFALPGMNGIAALAEIRKEDSLESVPVVAISASAMKGDREDFIALGFNDYISKPIDNIVFDEILMKYIS